MAEIKLVLTVDEKGSVTKIRSVGDELDKLTAAEKRAKDASAGLSGNMGGLKDVAQANTTAFDGLIGKVQGNTQALAGLSGSALAVTAAVGASVAVVVALAAAMAGVVAAAVAVGNALADATVKAIGFADKFTNLEAKTSIGVEALQKYEIAGKAFGIGAEQIATGAIRMSARIAEGSEKVKQAVGVIGLSFQELKGLQPEQQFELVAEKLRQIEDPGKRAAASIALMGRAGLETLPVMSKGFGDLAKEAEKLGFILEDSIVQKVDQTGDRIGFLGEGFEALVVRIGSVIASNDAFKGSIEALIGVVSDLNKWVAENADTFNYWVTVGILVAIDALSALLVGLGSVIAGFGQIGVAIAQVVDWFLQLSIATQKAAAFVPGLALFAKPLQDMASGLRETAATAGKGAAGLVDLGKQVADGAGKMQDLKQKLVDGSGAAAKFGNDLKGAGGKFGEFGDEADEAKKKLEKFADAFTKAGAQKQANELAALVKAVGGAAELSRPGLKKLVEEIKSLEEAGATIPPVLKEVVAELDRLKAASRAAAQELGSKMLSAAVEQNFKSIAASVGRSIDEIEKSTDKFSLKLAQSMEMPDTVPGALNAFERYRAEAEKARQEELEFERQRRAAITGGERFAEDFGRGLGAIAELAYAAGDAFEQMGLSAESGFGRVASEIIQTIGLMQQAAAAGAQIKAGLKKGGAAGAVNVGLGALGAAGAIGSATAHGSTGARTLKGAAAGAAAGNAIVPVWGAIVGAGVGAIVGFIRGRKMAKDMDRVKDALGAKLSEAFVEGARKVRDNLKKQGFDVGVGEASLLMLDKAFEDVGGVGKFGMDKAAKAVGNLQNAIKLGTLPAAEGLAQVGKAFTAMAAEALKAGDVIDKSTLSVIQRSKELGQKVPEIQEFVRGQLEAAAQALPSALSGIKIVSAEDAQAQATIFSTTFWGAVKEMGLLQAVEAFKPAWEALNKSLADVGFSVDLGGVGEIFALLENPDFGPLLSGVDGLAKALAGLSNSGYLTEQSFAAFQQQAMSAFNQLTAAGLSQELSLQAIAPLLQNIISASQAYGFTIDENTANLIAQADAAGIGFKTDPMEKMVSVLELIATKLGATADELAQVGAKAAGAAGQVGQLGAAVDSIPKEVNVEFRATRTGDWTEESPRTGGEGEGAQHGALVTPRPGGAQYTVGEGGKAEVIAPVDALFSRLADHLAERIAAPGAAGGGAGGPVYVSMPVDVHVDVSGIMTADPMELARKTAEATRLAVRDNVDGLASEIRRAGG